MGVLSGLSFLRTEWAYFHPDFFLWFSIFSLLANIFLIFVTQEQILKTQSKKEIGDAQIQIWLEAVKGVITALSKIQSSIFTEDKDTKIAISLIEPSVSSLFQSLSKAAGNESEVSAAADQQFSETMSTKALDTVKQSSPSKPENRVDRAYVPKQGKEASVIKTSQSEKAKKGQV